MDVFVFPSRYEGLGMAVVEAQACGVRTIASNRVPIQAKIVNTTAFLNLSAGPNLWASTIVAYEDKTLQFLKCKQDYDITIQAGKWASYYNGVLYAEKQSQEVNTYKE